MTLERWLYLPCLSGKSAAWRRQEPWVIYLCHNELYFKSVLCIFMGLKLIGKFCSSVLIMQTQEARIILFISSMKTKVCTLAPCQ